MKEINTLAIVGNGFDLAHNYKTSFENFKNSVTVYLYFCLRLM